MKQNYYNPEIKTMNYFTPPAGDGNLFGKNTDQMNEVILRDFYAAVEWLLNRRYDEYTELISRTINPAQQNAFYPLREYRVKRNGHYKLVNIYHRLLGGCWIEERVI